MPSSFKKETNIIFSYYKYDQIYLKFMKVVIHQYYVTLFALIWKYFYAICL